MSNTQQASRPEEQAPASEENVKLRAYEIWEDEGRPEGRHLDHWQRATRELSARNHAPAAPTLVPKDNVRRMSKAKSGR